MWVALRRQNLYDDPYEPPEAARLRASALGDGEQLGTVFHKRKQLRLRKGNSPKPIGSMYAIYGNIYHQYAPNVTIYIHICHTWSIWEVDLLFSQKIHEIPVIEPTKMVSHGDAKNSMIPKDRAIPLVFYIYGNYIILYYIYN